ncbi:hypothetical protein E2C01_061780 [Portunus trituberculatus]|uniref:Uncharacterized protein n=1 Tax=Portunus trituberculatus TaxID=210409 RepID=A0A5B7HBX6_PORTR|nr:hypothetical protein [Portunus trituberculatus]
MTLKNSSESRSRTPGHKIESKKTSEEPEKKNSFLKQRFKYFKEELRQDTICKDNEKETEHEDPAQYSHVETNNNTSPVLSSHFQVSNSSSLPLQATLSAPEGIKVKRGIE